MKEAELGKFLEKNPKLSSIVLNKLIANDRTLLISFLLQKFKADDPYLDLIFNKYFKTAIFISSNGLNKL